MIAFLPHCGFLSEVSRATRIAGALRSRGVPVVFAARGGPYAHLIDEAGFSWTRLRPALDGGGARRFLDALLSMGRTDEPFFEDEELRLAVDAEVAFLLEVGARAAVTGFTLSACLSTRIAGVPLVTDHGGSFVPPVLAHGLCPAPVHPPDPGMARLPTALQRWLANVVPALLKRSVAQLNRHADRLGVERLPGMMGLMCGDLTLVTEVPEVLGLPRDAVEGWRPRWPHRVRQGTTFRFTGPLYARLDRPVPAEVDAWLSAPGAPVVYLAPTSVHEPFLRALVSQARAAGVRLLVGATLHDVGDLADDQTFVAGVLPNHLVMPRVAAAVIMGGQGSVQTAMASGTPFVGLPYHGEQELNVAVAERLGMALRLAPPAATTPALPEALRRLLAEPAFSAAARRAARHYADVDGAAQAADALLAYLGVDSAAAAAASG
jgi:UDP:flavonoid glycosyltransferase YjiC (YdhE family)